MKENRWKITKVLNFSLHEHLLEVYHDPLVWCSVYFWIYVKILKDMCGNYGFPGRQIENTGGIYRIYWGSVQSVYEDPIVTSTNWSWKYNWISSLMLYQSRITKTQKLCSGTYSDSHGLWKFDFWWFNFKVSVSISISLHKFTKYGSYPTEIMLQYVFSHHSVRTSSPSMSVVHP